MGAEGRKEKGAYRDRKAFLDPGRWTKMTQSFTVHLDKKAIGAERFVAAGGERSVLGFSDGDGDGRPSLTRTGRSVGGSESCVACQVACMSVE